MAFLSYLQVFSTYWCSTLLLLLPGIITYKRFALFLAIISAIALATRVIANRFIIPVSSLYIAEIVFFIVIIYYLTSYFRYIDGTNPVYWSFFLALCGQVAPAVITATFVCEDKIAQMIIKKYAPIVSIVFTLIVIMAVFFSTSMTSGGYIDNENGLNYQSASYMAAYASALMEYFLLTRNDNEQLKITKKKGFGVLAVIIIVIDFMCILLAGGRGGLVTAIIYLIVTYFLEIKREGSFNKLHLKRALYCILFLSIACVLIQCVKNMNINVSGYERIISFLQTGDSNGRDIIRAKAIASFAQRPILGHGLGSVFYEIQSYSHNLFTDVLVESGIVGLFVMLGILIVVYKKAIALIREDYSNCIWIYFFLAGFCISMFSGYYLGNVPLWWGIVFIICLKQRN